MDKGDILKQFLWNDFQIVSNLLSKAMYCGVGRLQISSVAYLKTPLVN